MTATVGMSALRRTWRRIVWLGGQPLHRRRPGVVGLEDVDRPGPGHPRDVPEVDDGHRRGGHEQVADLGRDVGVGWWRREDRQQLELDPDDHDEDRSPVTNSGIDDERDAEQHDRRDRLVCPGVARRRAPAVMASGMVMKQGEAGQLGRADHRVEELRQDGLVR